MKKSLVLLSFSICLMFTLSAYADVLCVKNSQTAKKNKVNFSGAFKVVSGSTCDKGYTALLDTSVFKGDTGNTGATGATGATGEKGNSALSDCVVRELETSATASASDQDAKVEATKLLCQSGEYGVLYTAASTITYSSDFSVDGVLHSNAGQMFIEDMCGDGKDQVGSSYTCSTSPNLVEQNGHFNIGVQLFEMRVFIQDDDEEITAGTKTITSNYKLTCCKL